MKVILADDENEIREPLSAVFKAKGAEVREFGDGRSALDSALSRPPDLIILDVMMPKMSGWDACRELKTNEKTKDIPVIILTARTKDMDELMTAEAGADLYLKKPFNPLEVYAEAQKLLGGKQ
ncbi:MAG: response regulator [Candidatus Saganbacteria bacterium]|nr:response regulator [Candidatus Saganbacteria bacterium]